MCSERDSPLEPFVLPAPGQPELARLTCGAHLGPPVLTRKQKRPRVNSLVCDRAAVFCAAGPPEALSWMSRLVTQAAKRERELARAHSQRLKQATLSLPGESVSRGFADRGALEGYPSHYTSLLQCKHVCVKPQRGLPYTKLRRQTRGALCHYMCTIVIASVKCTCIIACLETIDKTAAQTPLHVHNIGAESRFAPSQWETSLQCNAVSHWLDANLESYLCLRPANERRRYIVTPSLIG